MTKEEINKKLEVLKNNPRVTNLYYNPEFLEEDRENSLWYGGFLISFKVDNRYNITISAVGDNIGSVLLRNGEVEFYKDKTNNGYLGYLLRTNGIIKDSDFIVKNKYFDFYNDEPDMTDFEENKDLKAVVYADYGNWFEAQIEDAVTGESTDYTELDFIDVIDPDIDGLISML